MSGDSVAGNKAVSNKVNGDLTGVIQVMVASGDKASYTMGERDFIVASDIAPNYLLLTADRDKLAVMAYNGGHMLIDSFEMRSS
jgi:hypothetical protein